MGPDVNKSAKSVVDKLTLAIEKQVKVADFIVCSNFVGIAL